MNSSVEADDGYPLLKERVSVTFTNWKKELAAVITEGQMSGEFKAEVHASEMANLIIAGIEGSILIAKSTQNKNSFGTTLNYLKSIIEKQLKQ